MCTEKNIEGIWHTAIVVFGKEHFFGSNGISICKPVSLILNSYLYELYYQKILFLQVFYMFKCISVPICLLKQL